MPPMASASSDGDLLLGTPLAPADPDADHPVRLRAFRRNVRYCKIALGFSLATSLVTGIVHLAVLPPHVWSWKPWLPIARFCVDALSLSLTVGSTLLFLWTLKDRPFPARLRPADLGGLANMGLHRATCVAVFLQALVCLALHAAPGVVYIILNKHAPPDTPAAVRAGRAHVVALLATMLAAGCMRRGPRLRAREPSLAAGFGLRPTQNVKFQLKDWDGDEMPWERPVIDYGNCSMLTFLSLGYSVALAEKSMKNDQLTQADLPMLEEWVRTAGNEYLADIGPKGGHPHRYTAVGLVKVLWSGRGWAIFLTFVLETLNTVISFVQVTALHEIISSFGAHEDDSYAYLMCWGLLLGQVVEVLLSAYLWVRENYILHNPVRMIISAILYSKILRSTDAKAMEAQHLTSTEDEKANKGRSQAMNLLTIDTGTVSSMATYVWGITNGLVRLFIGLLFLYSMLGVSALVGLACIPLVTPISIWVAKKSYECDRSWARARDARTGAIKEFLMGVKVIKLNGFEEYEERRIGHLRDIETRWQRWRYTLGTLFNIIADQMPVVAIFLTFVVHTRFLHQTLDPATAFVSLNVFLRVQSGLESLPRAVDVVLSTKIALDRLKGYLNQNEVVLNPNNVSETMVAFDRATFSWPRADGGNDASADSGYVFSVRDVTLSLPVGRMTLVCGPLGAGKTLFLRALLGEAKVDSGRIVSPRSAPNLTPLDASMVKPAWTNDLWLENSIAYAPQASYIRHGTIRDNILFGQPFWKQRYDEVIRECALGPDLMLLVNGDITEVGENGVNLSGGQKARINLARCVYSRARTIYLDDVLSAVDAHTAKYIVQRCFRGELLRGRTVVLVSHHVDLCLPVSDFVVALSEGRIKEACSARRAKVSSLQALTNSPKQKKHRSLSTTTERSDSGAAETHAVLNSLVAELADGQVPPPTEDEGLEGLESVGGDVRALYRDEHQATGHVVTSHYWMMITAAGGWWYWLVFALLYLGAQGATVLVTVVLQWWTGDPRPSRLEYYLGLYVVSNLAAALAGAARWVWLYGIGNIGWYSAGTKKIHRKLVATIINAPLSFFETTPAGRILNIFAQDTRRIDSMSADDFGRTTMEVIRVVTAAAIVSYEAPSMLIVLVAFGAPLYTVANGLGKLRTNLRRLAAVADSPLISLYHDSIDGVVMLRAFGLPNVMAQAMKTLINRSRTAETWNWVCYNFVRAATLSFSSVFVTATGFLLVGRDISGAKAGFILNFAAQMSSQMFSLLEQFIQLEQTFVSAERINNCILDTPQEPDDGVVPSPEWPEQGRLAVRNLSVRYADDLPDVLHDVSFDISPGQRVGIVGATGSGKSTLALSLFRAVEPRSGSIEIDGTDLGSLNLRALRSRLNMVVQDSSLPSGTLRNALDVSGERDDHEIYDALRRVHLLPKHVTPDDVKTNPFANLDTFVAIEGSNFSHGQRQLLCLARALLKRSRFLVMDEATSSVDFEMDAKITATIRECFADTTMLVIAHRLATIVAYDRVLVLDKGRVAEYDSPLALMERQGSAFRALCMAHGYDEFERLLRLAKQ